MYLLKVVLVIIQLIDGFSGDLNGGPLGNDSVFIE